MASLGTCGYKCREQALQSRPEQIPAIIRRALDSGIDADYVPWIRGSPCSPIFNRLLSRAWIVIGMAKNAHQCYTVDGKQVSLKKLYRYAQPLQSKKGILRSVHTVIVFARYIVLSWQNRCHTGLRTIGGLFYELCDEVNELNWAVALQQLLELLQDALKRTNKNSQKLIQCQLEQWISSLPSCIKAYLPISLCES